MRILIAEDDTVSRRVLSAMLQKQGHEVVETSDGAQAWRMLQTKEAPSLLILDIMMPGMDGLELCRRLRATESRNAAYIILLTAKTSKEDVVLGLEAGANDYITKPYDFGELQARVNVGERMLQMQSSLLEEIAKRREMEEKLRKISLYDSLTDLYSRSFFEAEMKRLSMYRHSPVGIIVCDIDGLKLINDTLGHTMGDKLLKTAAQILQRCFRASDIIARIGGDEFAVLLPESSRAIVQECAWRVRKEIEEFNSQENGFGLSISIGSAVNDEHPVDMQNLFKKADDAMYKQKLQQDSSSRSAKVQALIKTMKIRDHATEGHASRIQEYAQHMGQALGLSEERMNYLGLLAQFHDLGKVGVTDSILFKPGRLNAEEFEEIKRHCEIGHRIALSLSDLAPIADYILKHHEWWDGQGYPLGLTQKEIPLECRILSIVDSFDAMTSNRPYHGPMSSSQAIQELKKCAGTQFDPELVDIFVQILEKK